MSWTLREENPRSWTIEEWRIVDLYHLRVRFKPEFNASYQDLYERTPIILSSSGRAGANLGEFVR